MYTDDLVRHAAWLRHEHQRLIAERNRLITERHKIAAEARAWAWECRDLGPVYDCRLELLQGRPDQSGIQE